MATYGILVAWGLVVVWSPYVETRASSPPDHFRSAERVLYWAFHMEQEVRTEIRLYLPDVAPPRLNRSGRGELGGAGPSVYYPDHRHLRC